MTGGPALSAGRERACGRGRWRAGPGRQGEDALRELQLPAGPVRERGEGRPSGPAGKEKEREGGPANGLGFSFTAFPISYFFPLFYFKHHSNLFEFKSNLNSNSYALK